MAKASRRRKARRQKNTADSSKKNDLKSQKKGAQPSPKTSAPKAAAPLTKEQASSPNAPASAPKESHQKVSQQKVSQKELEKQLSSFEISTKKAIADIRAKLPQIKISKEIPEKITAWTSFWTPNEAKKIFHKSIYTLVGIAAITTILVTVELLSHERIFPHTKAGELNLGLVPRARAQQELTAALKEYGTTPFRVIYNETLLEIMPDELGITISGEKTLQNLPVLTFQQTRPWSLLALAATERSIPVSFTLDVDKAIRTLEEKFDLTDKLPRGATFVPSGNTFEIQAEKEGQAINREKLVSELRSNIQNLESRNIALEVQYKEPDITAAQLQQEKDHLIGLLNRSIKLSSDEKNITIRLRDHLNAVSFHEKNALKLEGQKAALPVLLAANPENADAQAQDMEIASLVQLVVDPQKIEPFLRENLITHIEKPTSPANLYTNDQGQVVVEGKGEDGRSVPLERLAEAISLAANFGISEVPVPIIVQAAPLTISDDLRQKGITELVATGHSAYYGSPPNRMFNIDLGTKKYNGVLIAPGQEFSFNDVLGPVDNASGFKVEKIIKKNKIEYEVGGGICQVSTTMYRAALLAGLPITERRPHSWKVSYYSQSMGDGLDATIYPGVSDVKFINDTPGHLLVQAYTDSAEAYFKLYGTKDGRTVALDGPHGGGLTWRWNRTIAKASEEPKTEEIWSRYKPIPPPDVVPVATPQAESTPAPTPAQ